MQHFASDNYAGICPEALAALLDANAGHAPAYGDDEWTRQVSDRLREVFATDCDVYFVFNGTAANSLALASLCQSYHSVVCHELAHVETDECGGPEFFSNGSKLLPAGGDNGKLTPEAVLNAIGKRSDIHYPKPRVVTLTQATEISTVYRPDEIGAIARAAHAHGLRVHMDGARFANAVASLDVDPADITWRAGVDVLCFGGTKMGLPVGEAVVFFNRELAEDFAYRCKQAGQLASKMRFLSAPWLGILADGAWLRHALTPMPWLGDWPTGCATPQAPGCCFRWKPTAFSSNCHSPSWKGCATVAGASTPSSAQAGHASCAPGTPPRPASTPCSPTFTR